MMDETLVEANVVTSSILAGTLLSEELLTRMNIVIVPKTKNKINANR